MKMQTPSFSCEKIFHPFWVLVVGLLVGFLLGSVWGPQDVHAGKPHPWLSGIEKIDADHRAGRLTDSEVANYKVAAVFDPGSLPAAYVPRAPIKGATAILRDVIARRAYLNPENQKMLLRPTDASDVDYYGDGIPVDGYASAAGHFRLHFTTDAGSIDKVPDVDTNQNQVPDYVEKYSVYLETSWTQEVGVMGYKAPPGDRLLGGDGRVDVYIKNINAYGVTLYDDHPSDTYMIVENDYSENFPLNQNPGCTTAPEGFIPCQEGDMKATAAHEFFHVLQWQMSTNCLNSGSIGADNRDHGNCWWMEASATWMEDVVFPDVNDYVNYTGEWFLSTLYEATGTPLSLDTFDGGYEYGTAIWVKHLSEKYGDGIVREVWNMIRDPRNLLTYRDASSVNGLEAIQAVLASHGSSLALELREFRTKNGVLLYWNTPYEDGADYPGTVDGVYGNSSQDENYASAFQGNCRFPLTLSGGNCVLNPLSAYYALFVLPPSTGNLVVTYAGDTSKPAPVILVVGITKAFDSFTTGAVATDLYVVSELNLNASQQGTMTIGPFGPSTQLQQIMVIVQNPDTVDVTQGTLEMVLDTSGASPTVTSFQISPDNATIGRAGRVQYGIQMRDQTEQVLTSAPTWSSSDAARVSIDGNGLATGTNAGAVQISAAMGGLNSSTLLTLLLRAGKGNSDSRCFIATAAFGTPLHPYVQVLREFRDRFFLTNSLGKSVVATYYEHSPRLAATIAGNDGLRAVVGTALIPVVALAALMVKTSLLEKGILFLVIWGSLVEIRRRRDRRLEPSRSSKPVLRR